MTDKDLIDVHFMKNAPISRRQILGEKRPMSNAKRLFSMNLNQANT